jgi:hypothetical protein
MACLCCGGAPELGVLCRSCALAVAPCDGLIADHLRSTIGAGDAAAWVIDGFGGAHAIGATSRIGRSQDSALIVLASSVSREHAELTRTAAGWTVRDLGSRNGTFVDGARCVGRSPLDRRAQLKVGDVALWFLADVVHEPSRLPTMATGGGDGVVRYQLTHRGAELCLLGNSDRAAGGALLSRPLGAEVWTECGLAPLEFQLLRTLCARAHDDAGSPSAVRGCVPTKQLARELPFQSRYANEENVRQVVRRLRGVLAEAGGEGVLEVVPGRGYYVACRVARLGPPPSPAGGAEPEPAARVTGRPGGRRRVRSASRGRR